MKEPRFITARQVMKRYGKTYHQLMYAVRTGKLHGEKLEDTWQWIFDEELLPPTWPVKSNRS
jgi:hypothetical protein